MSKTKPKAWTRERAGLVNAVIQGGITDRSILALVSGADESSIPDDHAAIAEHAKRKAGRPHYPARTCWDLQVPLKCEVCGAQVSIVPCVYCTLRKRKPKYRLLDRCVGRRLESMRE